MIDLVDSSLEECSCCPWKDRKSKTVPPEGPVDSPLMVIGGNPGYQEDQRGRPFVREAPAGRYISRFFEDSCLSRDKIYITNTAKCFGGPGDPGPTEEVFDCCEQLLLREIDLVNPKLVLLLGSDAYRRVTGDRASILFIQGQVKTFFHKPGRVFFPLTHTSFWARKPGYYDNVIKGEILVKFQTILKELKIFDALV